MTEPTRVLELDQHRAVALTNYTMKLGLLMAFFVAIVIEPSTVEGKAMGFRAPLFLASAVLVPVLARRRNWHPYPHAADALLASPFLVDTLGNLLGFYNAYAVTDDVLHVLNWVLLVMAYHAFRFRNIHERTDAILLGYGIGAIAIVWWEVMEWVVSEDGIGGAGGLQLNYGDTIGDLFLSSSGGLLGSIIALFVLGPTLDR